MFSDESAPALFSLLAACCTPVRLSSDFSATREELADALLSENSRLLFVIASLWCCWNALKA